MGIALAGGLISAPSWAEPFFAQEAEALPADIQPPMYEEIDPLEAGLQAGEHDHDDEELVEPATASTMSAPSVTVQDESNRPEYLGQSHYRAEIHSHTSISDGTGLPKDAFKHVAENSNADFFAVTDHDVVFDIRNGDSFAEDRYNAYSEEWSYSHEAADEFNASSDHLLALIGEEVTWYNQSGHLNIYNSDWFVTAKSEGGGTWGTGDLMWDVPTVMARLTMDPDAIGQFNHPASGHGHFGFGHLTPEADAQIPLFEYKGQNYHDTYVKALDAGWHVAPVWSGDDHSDRWVTNSPAHTGVWADEHSLDGLYDAMRDRSMYTTFDEDATVQLGVNGEQMGTIFPNGTAELNFTINLSDGSDEAFTSAKLYTNAGAVAHDFDFTAGSNVDLEHTLQATDGEFYWLVAEQEDGQQVISSPVWVGDKVSSANYAPELTVASGPETADYGQQISLSSASATDDSGNEPTLSTTVYNRSGEVEIVDGKFAVESYADHFIVTKATDAQGNVVADIHQIKVNQEALDPAGVFQYFGSTATVGATADQTGLSVSTDPEIEQTWAQVLPAGSNDWSKAQTVESVADQVYEVDTIGTDAANYQDSITGQTLRAHEFTFSGLEEGETYQYRFGVSPAGDWTEPQGEFISSGASNTPLYVMGDLQVSTGEQADYELFNTSLAQIRDQKPGGNTVIQVGDLVDNAGRGEYWEQTHDYVLNDLDLRLAPLVGNHEVYGDKEFNVLSPERNAIFRGMFNNPDNGSAIGESNYSFDHGDVHVAVINSNYDVQSQLDWLVQDMRATDKPWTVVTGHFSYYGGSHADDAGMATDRALVTQTLDQLGVDLYIGGHDHVYKRSSIHGDALAQTAEEMAAGTTYVTMGSSGPKFYENQEFWWDDVVYDENKQVSSAIEVTDDGLKMTTYTHDGELVDEFTVTKPVGTWKVSSVDLVDQQANGIGFLSYEGARDSLSVAVAAYDYDNETLVDLRVLDVDLDHSGVEQYIAFDEPITADSSVSLKLFAWDSFGNGVPLLEPMELRKAMLGSGTAEEPYEIRTWEDIENIRWNPAGHYVLMNDLELDGSAREQIGSGATPFTGVFDGQGFQISGFQPTEMAGAGLFAVNEGTISNLAVVDAQIDTTQGTVGLLVDYNKGTIENSWTSGSIVGQNRVGGISGESTGIIRDSYSTADVRARATESGGVVAVALGGSTTERVYSTGNVTADIRNTGGVVGYGYFGTVFENSISLNESVTAPSYAHAAMGRVLSGQTAELANNFAWDGGYVSVESLKDAAAHDNLKGQIVAAADAQQPPLYTDQLGWDFENTWVWDEAAQRPILQSNTEEYVEPRPAGEPNADGYYEISTAEELLKITDFPEEKYVLTQDIDLSGIADWRPLGAFRPFTGEIDGGGFTITGLTSVNGGLVNINNGSIYDLGVVDAQVDLDGGRVGILTNINNGTLQNVYTTGSVAGGSRVGGISGDSSGVIRDAYTTADVHSRGTEAGGVVGVALAGSLTENVYATGAVVSEIRNIGGVVGYGYNGTEIYNVLALNTEVTASSYAHRVLGRVLSGNTATLDGLWASENVVAGIQSNTDAEGPNSWHVATATMYQVRDTAFYTETLGWDFDTVWAWNDDAARPVLQSATEVYTGEPVPPLPEPDPGELERDDDGFLLIETVEDLAEVSAQPDEKFRLDADIDLTGLEIQLAPTGFNGTFDGAGHVISGYSSTVGALFPINNGTIEGVGLEDALVTTTEKNVGLLVGTNHGTVAQVWTSGAITGHSTVGGVVGYSYGVIRDTYSTADVTADGQRQAGGVVGITGRGSLTERVYSTGDVEAVGEQNAGGITGYAYTGTTVQNSIALNPSVTGSSQASRVIARVLAGDTATMLNNYAIDTMVVNTQTVTAEGPETQNGQTVTLEQIREESFWTSDLGWDFESTWQWGAAADRPTLKNAPEGH